MLPELMATARRLTKALIEPFARPVHHLREVAVASPGVALLVLVVLVVTAVTAIRGSRLAALALVPLSLAWLVVNAAFEGPTLVALSWSHGVTAADLISLACLAVAGWRLGHAVVVTLR